MTPRVAQMKTQAETTLAEAFTTARAALPGGPSMRDLRDRAFDVFRDKGLPHRRIESWHYTDLRSLMRVAYPAAPVGSPPVTAKSVDGVETIVLVDGAPANDLAARRWPEGLTIRPLRDVLAEGRADLVTMLFPEAGSDDAMVALNAALACDGVAIEVAPGAIIAAPLELIFTTGTGDARADVSRSLLIAGAGSSITLVETHVAAARVQRNSALVMRLDEGASVEHVFESSDHAAELHVATMIVDVGARARLESFAFLGGGEVTRRQAFITYRGENAKVGMRGVTLLSGKRHADTTLVLDHAVARGESRELFKHIVADEATGVFQGKIIVRPHAQKTDGGMKSQAILLSDDAAMYNKPELEIFADDVVCGHGATVGQLDDDQLFYLMARGLPKPIAEALLIEGFAREAIDFVRHDGLRARLEASLTRWLERRSQ